MSRRGWLLLAASAVVFAACVRSLEGAACDADDTCGPVGSGLVCELPARVCVNACPSTHERCEDLRCVPSGTCAPVTDGGVTDSGITDAGGGGGSGEDGGVDGGLDGGETDGGVDGGFDGGELGCALAGAPIIVTPRSTFLSRTATSYELRWDTSAPAACELELTQGTQCTPEDGGTACGTITGTTAVSRVLGTANPLPISFGQTVGRRYLQLRVCEPNQGRCGPPSLGRTIYVGSTLGDVDGDRKADIVIGTLSTTAQLLQYRSGNNMNPEPLTIGAISGATNVSGVGDYTGDGISDIVVVGDAGVGTRRPVVMSGSMGGGLGSLFQESAGGPEQSAWGVGDINGDGYMDIAILDPANPVATLRISCGPGAIAVDFTSTAGFSPQSAAGVGDLNADGIDDFAVLGKSGTALEVRVFAGRTTLARLPTATDTGVTLSPPGSAVGSGIAGVGDIDGDGFGDFVVGRPGTGQMGPYVYRGSKTQLVQSTPLSSNQSTPLLVRPLGAVSGPGTREKYAFPNAQGVAVCAQTSTTVSACVTASSASPPTEWGSMGDYNADGKPDLALSFQGQTPVWSIFGESTAGTMTLLDTPLTSTQLTGAGRLLATYPAP